MFSLQNRNKGNISKILVYLTTILENIIPEIKTEVQSNCDAAFHLGPDNQNSTKIPSSYHRKQFETLFLGAPFCICGTSDKICHFWGVSGLEDFQKI